ncbi:protein of unknown function [Aminobacter niigataensis]|nr:protein of unknown function [Aminobacter niigataensis]
MSASPFSACSRLCLPADEFCRRVALPGRAVGYRWFANLRDPHERQDTHRHRPDGRFQGHGLLDRPRRPGK